MHMHEYIASKWKGCPLDAAEKPTTIDWIKFYHNWFREKIDQLLFVINKVSRVFCCFGQTWEGKVGTGGNILCSLLNRNQHFQCTQLAVCSVWVRCLIRANWFQAQANLTIPHHYAEVGGEKENRSLIKEKHEGEAHHLQAAYSTPSQRNNSV